VIAQSWQERLKAFLQSVIPADPAQLLLLIGIICFIFAPRMSWWSPQLNKFHSSNAGQERQVPFVFLSYRIFGDFTLIYSAFAGYFVCFWPGPRAVRRVFAFILLPATVAFFLHVGEFVYIAKPYSSVIDRNIFHIQISGAGWALWFSTPGFRVAFAGLLFIGTFTSRMMSGISSLPLSLSHDSVAPLSDSQFWRRIEILIWVLVGPLFVLTAGIEAGMYFLIVVLRRHHFATMQNEIFEGALSFLAPAILLAAVCWIVGKKGRELIRTSVRLCRPKYLFLGAAFSVGIAVLISSAQYLQDRSHWAAAQIGNYAAPQIGTYFNLPDSWVFLMFFAAFFEEIVFRGVLQSVFVRRYGLYRGIFLSGISWAAFHFNYDSYSHPTELGFLSRVSFRVAMCLAIGFVLSWLTLRAASVLPAAVAHTLYNVLVQYFGPYFTGKGMVWVVLWAVLACLLFRFWPVRVENEFSLEIPAAEPGNTT
jgi:membrane protease YdiL (CAAX protease family)